MKAENRFLSENKAEGGEISDIQLPAEYRIIEKNATISVGKAGAVLRGLKKYIVENN